MCAAYVVSYRRRKFVYPALCACETALHFNYVECSTMVKMTTTATMRNQIQHRNTQRERERGKKMHTQNIPALTCNALIKIRCHVFRTRRETARARKTFTPEIIELSRLSRPTGQMKSKVRSSNFLLFSIFVVD